MEKFEDIIRFVTFKLADNLLGMNILDIREIVPGPKITPVQHAPEAVLGLINLRGQILTALDIRVLLNFDMSINRQDSYLIVFKHHDVGFLVDQVGDVITKHPDEIESVPANIDHGIKPYMDHVIEEDSQLIMAINAQKILAYTPVAEEME